MRYLDLFAARPLVWSLFLLYLGATAWLAFLGWRKTRDLKSFATGGGAMSPVVVGITLAASMASTATFVINPGFVYQHGVAALMHLGVAVSLGIITGLVTLSAGFQRIGARTGALTLPHWIGQRYGSPGLAVLFALLGLLYLSFIVLLVGSLSIVCQLTLGLTNLESVALVIVFVFGYVLLGGAWAHAYTNTLQGIIKAVVAVMLVGSGLAYLGGGLHIHDSDLLAWVNHSSPLFHSVFSVYVSGFVMGFAVCCQPHIMSKALYVKDRRAVRRYLVVAIALQLVYTAVLLVGLYAHAADLPPAAVARQDAVATAYINHTFSSGAVAVILLGLLAGGMSALAAILMALSSSIANDLFLPLARRTWLKDADDARRSRAAHRAGQAALVLLGAVAFVIALHPPRLLGIFGQVGVYGLVAAATAPILFGILCPQLGARSALAAALLGLGLHFGLYFGGASPNPAVPAAIAILSSCGLMAAVELQRRLRTLFLSSSISRRSSATSSVGVGGAGAGAGDA
ncbi:MAG TPA: hypothetical protein VL172_15055 [Kofleriaceae bacterium]|nr:hypothetical protein [Kofleriaceae bacterium]